MILLRLHTFTRMLSIIAKLGRSGNLRVWMLAVCRRDRYARLRQAAPAGAKRCPPLPSPAQPSSSRPTAPRKFARRCWNKPGTPVQNGTTVTFSTNLGVLAPFEARTFNGVATVQFLGNGQSGKATIKAISGGAASEALELSVGAGATGRVNLTANPTSVPSTGGTTTITALVDRCVR